MFATAFVHPELAWRPLVTQHNLGAFRRWLRLKDGKDSAIFSNQFGILPLAVAT